MKALRDLQVGVVGCGRIGREVVRRLAPFKCRIRIFDPAVTAGEVSALGGQLANSLDDLLLTSDLLTLHCPSTPQTRRMINHNTLAKLKPGAILINVGRGDLVETAALVTALGEWAIGGSGAGCLRPGANSNGSSAAEDAQRSCRTPYCLCQSHGRENVASSGCESGFEGAAGRAASEHRQWSRTGCWREPVKRTALTES